MNKDMVDIMCCPVCKGDLQLSVEAEKGGDIASGSLYCARCNVDYRINEGIPNMLPPEMAAVSKDNHGK